MRLIKEKIMRNDFYVGIYEDKYLAHSITPLRSHKYVKKIFVNGRWRYYYWKGQQKLKKIGRQIDADLMNNRPTDVLDPRTTLIKSTYQAFKAKKKRG